MAWERIALFALSLTMAAIGHYVTTHRSTVIRTIGWPRAEFGLPPDERPVLYSGVVTLILGGVIALGSIFG
jgi:hypothetical protein